MEWMRLCQLAVSCSRITTATTMSVANATLDTITWHRERRCELQMSSDSMSSSIYSVPKLWMERVEERC